MTSKSSRRTLKRDKLDFTEVNADDMAPYPCGVLASHRRPFELQVSQRPEDRVLDRALTEPLDDSEGYSSSSSGP